MTSIVFFRGTVLLVLLALLLTTFASTIITRRDALIRDPDIKTSLIGEHSQSYSSHRIKRGFWDVYGIANCEFACDDSTCISSEQRCNFTPDCDDESDELYCPEPPECEPSQFRCNNGQCISIDVVCDRSPDCYDNSDEKNCTAASQCNPETEFSCEIDSQCIPLEAKCDGMFDCMNDSSDEANCPSPETATTAEVPEATTDRVESRLEAVEKKLAGIDALNDLVHQLTDALKNLTASNESLKREFAELRKPNTDDELGKRLTNQDRRITQLEERLPNITQSVVPQQKFTELECRMFAMDLIIARRRYAP